MKFTLNNIARVSHAEIALDGITVLAGGNGTGKSTICRSLHALCE